MRRADGVATHARLGASSITAGKQPRAQVRHPTKRQDRRRANQARNTQAPRQAAEDAKLAQRDQAEGERGDAAAAAAACQRWQGPARTFGPGRRSL